MLCGKPPSFLLPPPPKNKTMGCFSLCNYFHNFFDRVPQKVVNRRDESLVKLVV